MPSRRPAFCAMAECCWPSAVPVSLPMCLSRRRPCKVRRFIIKKLKLISIECAIDRTMALPAWLCVTAMASSALLRQGASVASLAHQLEATR